jgi:hypothetical protein
MSENKINAPYSGVLSVGDAATTVTSINSAINHNLIQERVTVYYMALLDKLRVGNTGYSESVEDFLSFWGLHSGHGSTAFCYPTKTTDKCTCTSILEQECGAV